MADPRIIDIVLDERTIAWRGREMEEEYRIARLDLLAESRFRLLPEVSGDRGGPYRVRLARVETRLHIGVAREDDLPLHGLRLGLARFRHAFRDYSDVCGSFYAAVDEHSLPRLEAIDAARRALHDAAAGLLREALAGQVELDHDTARRLFTLIWVLAARG